MVVLIVHPGYRHNFKGFSLDVHLMNNSAIFFLYERERLQLLLYLKIDVLFECQRQKTHISFSLLLLEKINNLLRRKHCEMNTTRNSINMQRGVWQRIYPWDIYFILVLFYNYYKYNEL